MMYIPPAADNWSSILAQADHGHRPNTHTLEPVMIVETTCIGINVFAAYSIFLVCMTFQQRVHSTALFE